MFHQPKLEAQVQKRAQYVANFTKLVELQMQEKAEKISDLKGVQLKIEWGSQIRSYVLDDRWVKDLRSGYKVHNPDAVLNGDLQEFFKAYLMWERNPTGVVEDDD